MDGVLGAFHSLVSKLEDWRLSIKGLSSKILSNNYSKRLD